MKFIEKEHSPNLIKDTTDFLNKIENYRNQILEETILVTLDVESLYSLH